MDHPRTVDEIYNDYSNRREGLLKALTEDVDDFYKECDPERDNLCLYGNADGTWEVDLPAEEVPPELPEPVLGINFARDGMDKKDWLSLVAVHSDSWLISVAFFYGAKQDKAGRDQLFKLINHNPTLFEALSGKGGKGGNKPGVNKKRKLEGEEGVIDHEAIANGTNKPTMPGRMLQYNDINQSLKGCKAELFWPDDDKWYLIEIIAINARNRSCKIAYTSGETEELDLREIIEDGHMSICN